MRRIWIESAAAPVRGSGAGRLRHQQRQLLPHGDHTMLDVWNQETGGSAGGGQAARQLLDARQGLRRPLTEADVQATPAANAAYAHREPTKSTASSTACRTPTW